MSGLSELVEVDSIDELKKSLEYLNRIQQQNTIEANVERYKTITKTLYHN